MLLCRTEAEGGGRRHDRSPMTAFPDAGHAAKQDRDKKGQIGDCDHSKPPRAKGGGDHASGIPAVLFYHMPLSTLICMASRVYGVVFEFLILRFLVACYGVTD